MDITILGKPPPSAKEFGAWLSKAASKNIIINSIKKNYTKYNFLNSVKIIFQGFNFYEIC